MMRLVAVGLGFILALLSGAARADTPVALLQSFAGNVNFVGTQKTMRNRTNNNSCSVVSDSTTLTASLSGIPGGAEILGAHLYWAGSNTKAKADYKINFEGAEVSASPARQYFSTTIGSGYDYFAGAADVTAQVKKKGNGDYTFSGLTVSNGKPYCAVQGVLGGFSLLVIYAEANEAFRVLNLYEGFQYFRNSGITLNLGNFLIPNPLPTRSTARLGHITWEGDVTLEEDREELRFNGIELTDRTFNTAGNQFNSKSNINGDSASYGIDFDAYTVTSPIIQAGQRSARTRYQSGQDLVLLNAEIIAVPNVPTADLVMTITRNGELQVGRNSTYTLSASNAGPSTEPGPITVTATLPSNLTIISASGPSWSCSVSGQVVTCTAQGPLAKGATLPPITLTVQPKATGSNAVTAEVTGKLFDNILSNNTASNTSTAVVPRAGGYVFTVGECVPNVAIGAAGQTCTLFAGSMPAGSAQVIHVTAMASTNVPVALSNVKVTTVPVRFSLSCVNPAKTAGTVASYGTLSVPACAEGDEVPATSSAAWSQEVSLSFGINKASAKVATGSEFKYDDVGQIVLNLIDTSSKATASATVVSKPIAIHFVIKRKRTTDPAGGVANPGAVESTRARGFVRAGERFILGIAGRTATGRNAQNFGNEEGLQIAIEQNAPGSPQLTGTFHTLNEGVRMGDDFIFDDAGYLSLTPVLVPDDYLGAGTVPREKQVVGRFYPAWLETTVAPSFACLPAMLCPPTGVAGGAYSDQPFQVNVAAFSLLGTQLPKYKDDVAPGISLQALDAPGGTVLNPGSGTLNDISAAGATGRPRYRLPTPFTATTPRMIPGAPVTIYLRANASETVTMGPDTTVAELVTSKRAVATDSIEGGIRISNGRVELASAFGPELLRLPIRLTTQYWSGTRWGNNTTYDAPDFTYTAAFTGCTGTLQKGGEAAGVCNTDLLKAGPGTVKLEEGAGRFWLGAPGNARIGSALITITAPTHPWLPSTKARVAFGNVPRSPVIYSREMY
jgi:MSHA biogenesis protein MshQ